MISIPVAVNIPVFKMQLDLFWYNHKKLYGNDAYNKVMAIIIDKNDKQDRPRNNLLWDIDIPYKLCKSYNDFIDVNPDESFYKPLNIQYGLSQVLNDFNEDQVIEILDCDLFHMKPHPEIHVNNDEIYVCDLYENWHLKSLTDNKDVIDIYFENNGNYYNGGFVPIIGKVKTFKKILHEWTEVHKHILSLPHPYYKKWWAGMFALQASCEKNKITMIAKDTCYIPPINILNDNHYICHYCVDKIFNKKKYPTIEFDKFPNNIYYDSILEWKHAAEEKQQTRFPFKE
jgi:hypothetical protein